jgi:hypothetical protein
MTDNFLSPENDCGQVMLKLASRGSAILAELFKASIHIPEVFTYISKQEPIQVQKDQKQMARQSIS